MEALLPDKKLRVLAGRGYGPGERDTIDARLKELFSSAQISFRALQPQNATGTL